MAHRKLHGHSRRWSLSDILLLSIFGDEQLSESERLWHRVMPRFKGLLQSEYGVHDAKWKRVSEANEKRLALLFILLLLNELDSVTEAMLSGTIPIQVWQGEVFSIIRPAYGALMLLGRGGRANVTEADTAEVSADLRFTLERLERFARTAEASINSETTDKAFRGRARQYVRYGNKVYERARRAAHVAATKLDADGEPAYRFERNVLGNAEHCEQCLEETARDWVPIGTLSLPGERICRANCRCRIIYAYESAELFAHA